MQEGAEGKWMRNVLLTLMFAVGVAAVPPQPGKTPPSTKTSLTGCVDERDGQYVLTNDTNLQPTARLQPAAGSPEDNFARYMGQKVTVQGVLSKQEPLPIMTVESVQTVSQACAPASEAQPQ
jgi:hypothetical protein